VAAVLVLAREREGRSDPANVAALYEAALRLAPLDRHVLDAAAAYALRHGRTEQAITLLGRLVEHYGEERERAFPVLAASLLSGGDADAWRAVLARDPGWLGPFVVSSCRSGVDPLVLAPLVARRNATGHAKPEESACLVDRLRTSNHWAEAYQVWLN